MAYTDENGMRKVNGRFCVAIGSHFGVLVGQYFDIILENGTVIPCVMGDGKADEHTDESNIFTTYYGSYCCTEFIVNQNQIPLRVLQAGNFSKLDESWDAKVQTIRIYQKNILDK